MSENAKSKHHGDGTVGWTRITRRNRYGEPVNSILRVVAEETGIKDFHARESIEDWNFANGDALVIIKSTLAAKATWMKWYAARLQSRIGKAKSE